MAPARWLSPTRAFRSPKSFGPVPVRRRPLSAASPIMSSKTPAILSLAIVKYSWRPCLRGRTSPPWSSFERGELAVYTVTPASLTCSRTVSALPVIKAVNILARDGSPMSAATCAKSGPYFIVRSESTHLYLTTRYKGGEGNGVHDLACIIRFQIDPKK